MNTTTDTDAWKALLMNPRLSVIRPLATNDRRYGFTVDVSYLPDGTNSTSVQFTTTHDGGPITVVVWPFGATVVGHGRLTPDWIRAYYGQPVAA